MSAKTVAEPVGVGAKAAFARQFSLLKREPDGEPRHGEEPFATEPSSFIRCTKLDCFADARNDEEQVSYINVRESA